MDQNTVSLIIRNAREKHSGQYHVAISRRKSTSKTFHVTVHREYFLSLFLWGVGGLLVQGCSNPGVTRLGPGGPVSC